MKRVIIESPYAGDIFRNTEYARRCLKDSLDRGEAPLASHLLYPQVLDENDPKQRKQGIDAGIAWAEQADQMVVYVDYGISPGVDEAMSFWRMGLGRGKPERRTIGKNPGDE